MKGLTGLGTAYGTFLTTRHGRRFLYIRGASGTLNYITRTAAGDIAKAQADRSVARAMLRGSLSVGHTAWKKRAGRAFARMNTQAMVGRLSGVLARVRFAAAKRGAGAYGGIGAFKGLGRGWRRMLKKGR